MSALFNWSEEFETGVFVIDNQHRKFIQILNSLHHASKLGVSSLVIEDILKELKAYVDYHFSTEERYFAIFNYPGSFKHKREHDELKKKVSDYIKRYKSGDPFITIDLLNFLISWFKSHIKGYDVKFAKFLKKNNFKIEDNDNI